MPLAVGPCGVEEVAPEIDGALERIHRLVVARAAPAAHPPHPVTDFADAPPGPAERSMMHGLLGARSRSTPRSRCAAFRPAYRSSTTLVLTAVRAPSRRTK